MRIIISTFFLFFFISLSSCQEKDKTQLLLLGSVNHSIENLNQSVVFQNVRYYNILESVSDDDKRFYKWKEKGKRLKSESDKIFEFIQDLKIEMIKENGGSETDYKNFGEIVKFNDKEIVTNYLIKNKNGKEIKQKVQEYRRICQDFIKDDAVYYDMMSSKIDNHFALDFGILGVDDPVHWEKTVYEDLTLVEAILILTKIQADIRYTEVNVLNYLASHVDYNG
jgi:hypothetical protein